MDLEQPLSQRLRQGLIERHLGKNPTQSYSVSDHEYIFLRHLSDLEGPVMVTTLDTKANTISAGIYSSGPNRQITDDQIPLGFVRNERLDSALRRLDSGTLLAGEKENTALRLISEIAQANARLFDDKSQQIVHDFRRALDTPPSQISPYQEEIESACSLVNNAKVPACKNYWDELSNKDVVVCIMCRIPNALTKTNLISISVSPTRDLKIYLNMAHFPLQLIDSKGRELEPHFDILPDSMVFLGIIDGEAYTIRRTPGSTQ